MGPWVLVGVRGAVKALHTGSGKELQLRLPAGAQITTLLAEDDERLFAGAEDGAIYIWRLDREHQRFDEVAALAGHEGHAVASLAQGKGALYSGSVDGGIKVWDLETRRCIFSFAGHVSRITALLCWDRFLLSSSDDGTRRSGDRSQITAMMTSSSRCTTPTRKKASEWSAWMGRTTPTRSPCCSSRAVMALSGSTTSRHSRGEGRFAATALSRQCRSGHPAWSSPETSPARSEWLSGRRLAVQQLKHKPESFSCTPLVL
ncbi:hypothetical protein ACQ4PT_067615 [Festuca glaucescens]